MQMHYELFDNKKWYSLSYFLPNWDFSWGFLYIYIIIISNKNSEAIVGGGGGRAALLFWVLMSLKWRMRAAHGRAYWAKNLPFKPTLKKK